MGDEDEETGIHMHCFSCYRNHCQEFPQCSIIYCPNACGVQFHQCKVTEHVDVCRKQPRPCINVIHGCPFEVDSVSLMTHLDYCPASVVQCGINWNRAPLYSKVRNSWTPLKDQNPIAVEGDLDIEFAMADQKSLSREIKHRMCRGARKNSSKSESADISISKINHDRVRHLETLMNSKKNHYLTGRLESAFADTPSSSSRNCSFANKYEDRDFFTYDELLAADSPMQILSVSNTNMRDSYHDSPDCNYVYGQPDIARTSNKFRLIDEELTDLTHEEISKRHTVHSGLKLFPDPLGLNVTIKCLPSYYDKYPLYRFACNSLFRRDQFKWHVENTHADIAFSLNGWLVQRCPLSQYGCPYHRMRLKPKSRSVRFLSEFACFSTRYDDQTKKLRVAWQNNKCNKDLCDEERQKGNNSSSGFLNGDQRHMGLLDLPDEILVHLFFYLDNLTLNCVAKTCRVLRGICYSLIDNLGIVVTTWCKKTYEDSGTSAWKADRKIRFFTTCSSPIREWTHNETPHIGQHMQTCPFFHRRKLLKKVKLPMNGLLKTHVIPKDFTPQLPSPTDATPEENSGSDENDELDEDWEHLWMA